VRPQPFYLSDGNVLATSEAARLLGVSETHAIRLARSGQLGVIETPLGRLYQRSDVERLAAERRLTAGATI
jgi:excisionase family DNA binding protein